MSEREYGCQKSIRPRWGTTRGFCGYTLGASGVVETNVERRMVGEGTGVTSDSELPYTDADCQENHVSRMLWQVKAAFAGTPARGDRQTASIAWELDLYLLQRHLRSAPSGTRNGNNGCWSQRKRMSSSRLTRTLCPRQGMHASSRMLASCHHVLCTSLGSRIPHTPRIGDGHTPEIESDDSLDVGSTKIAGAVSIEREPALRLKAGQVRDT